MTAFPDDAIVVDQNGAVLIPAAMLDDIVAEAQEQEHVEVWIMDEMLCGAPLPGLSPISLETKARHLKETERN